MQLMDDLGQHCGHIGEGEEVPAGYWTRADSSGDEMSPLEFLDKIGGTRFGSVWLTAVANAGVAFPMVRGFAAQVIHLSESFPVLKELERQGILPDGTAIEVWS